MKYIKIYQTRQDFDNDMSNLDYPILALIQDTNETISLLREPEPEPVTYEMTSDWLQWQNVYKGQSITTHLTITGSDGSNVTLTSINDLTITNDENLPFDMLLDNNNNLTLVNNSDIIRAGERITVTLQYEDAILQLNAYSAVHTYTLSVSKNPLVSWANSITCSFGQYNVDKTEGEPFFITMQDENNNYVEPTNENLSWNVPVDYRDNFNWRFGTVYEGEEYKSMYFTYSQDTSFDFTVRIYHVGSPNYCSVRCVYETAAKADIESALPVVNDILDSDTVTAYDEAQYDNYMQLADDILS